MTELDYQYLLKTVDTVVCALKHRDLHTQEHSKRVVGLANELGVSYKLSKSDLQILDVAAYCHDIGKIGIPDAILLKPEKLNLQEWEAMKAHSEMGEEIVKFMEIEKNTIISKAVRHHHENFDGSGYPDQLKGQQIPIFSRIISLADSYDAITASRPYRNSNKHEIAMEIITKEKGVMFDPNLVEIFVNLIETSKFKSFD